MYNLDHWSYLSKVTNRQEVTEMQLEHRYICHQNLASKHSSVLLFKNEAKVIQRGELYLQPWYNNAIFRCKGQQTMTQGQMQPIVYFC